MWSQNCSCWYCLNFILDVLKRYLKAYVVEIGFDCLYWTSALCACVCAVCKLSYDLQFFEMCIDALQTQSRTSSNISSSLPHCPQHQHWDQLDRVLDGKSEHPVKLLVPPPVTDRYEMLLSRATVLWQSTEVWLHLSNFKEVYMCAQKGDWKGILNCSIMFYTSLK